MRLRDEMITDRVATNASAVIPKCLQIKDGRLKTVKRFLAEKIPPEKSSIRTLAILYSSGDVIFSDHRKKDKVSGEYEITRVKEQDCCF